MWNNQAKLKYKINFFLLRRAFSSKKSNSKIGKRSIKVREGDWMEPNVEKLLYICNTNSLAIRQKERSGVGKAGIHTK